MHVFVIYHRKSNKVVGVVKEPDENDGDLQFYELIISKWLEREGLPESCHNNYSVSYMMVTDLFPIDRENKLREVVKEVHTIADSNDDPVSILNRIIRKLKSVTDLL